MEDIIGASEEQVSESSTVRKKEQILSYLRRNRVGHEYLVDNAARQAIASEIGCNHEYVRQALKTLAKQGKINCTVRKRGQGQVILFLSRQKVSLVRLLSRLRSQKKALLVKEVI